jgi:hypothetical protein
LWKAPSLCVVNTYVADFIFEKMLFVPKQSKCSFQHSVDNGLRQNGDSVPEHYKPSEGRSVLRTAVILWTGMAVSCSELKF